MVRMCDSWRVRRKAKISMSELPKCGRARPHSALEPSERESVGEGEGALIRVSGYRILKIESLP